MTWFERFIAVTGGVGERSSHSVSRNCCLPTIAFIVNTGDDFEHLGLHISPDIDTLVYTLSGQQHGARLGAPRRNVAIHAGA
jgi:LPPG:FO 2-phospho-L-lactate transferase